MLWARIWAATFLSATVVACTGGASSASPSALPPASPVPSVAAVQLPTLTSAAPSCPTAATVGSALGVTLPPPVGVTGGGAIPLPAGAVAVVCEYHGGTLNVLIEEISNVSPSYLSNFVARFPVSGTPVTGLGDQAEAFSQSLSGGATNEGVVASRGSTIVDITATETPATLAQIEALINSLF